MKTSRLFFVSFLMLVVIGTLVGCTNANQKSPDVADNIRKALDQAGLKDVSVSQDRDKGVVTLAGNVSKRRRKGSSRVSGKVHRGSSSSRQPDRGGA